MNLIELQRSRAKPRPGDIFVILVRDRGYLFGRVIADDARPGPRMDESWLIYIYSYVRDDMTPPSTLSPDDLLIPPLMINKLGWSRGYFQTVENRPLTKKDHLPRHCFFSPMGQSFNDRGKRVVSDYFDEYNRPLRRRFEPCGTQGLASYAVVDDEVSQALGLPTEDDGGIS